MKRKRLTKGKLNTRVLFGTLFMLLLVLGVNYWIYQEDHKPQIIPTPQVTKIPTPEEVVIKPSPQRETPTPVVYQNIINLVNAQRSAYGLQPVSENAQLNRSAYLKAQDEVDKGYWSHTSPDGSYFTVFLQQAGYPYANAGENLGRRYYDDAELVAAWMVSPTHRDNILEPRWKEVGFARVGEHTAMHFGYR